MPAHKFAFTGILREPAQTFVKLKLQLVQLESLAWMLLAIGETWLPLDLFIDTVLLELLLLPVESPANVSSKKYAGQSRSASEPISS